MRIAGAEDCSYAESREGASVRAGGCELVVTG